MSVIDGTSGKDTLPGTPDADTINGLDGNDYLEGLGGDDFLNGGRGIDFLLGGEGNDTLNGGPGNDWADYGKDAGAVTVDLTTNSASDGTAGTDVLVSVFNVIGSAFDDYLIGNGGGNSFFGGDGSDTIGGGAGNDTIEGGAGEDNLDGGLGFDTLSYANSAGGVSINLQTNTASGGDAQGDQITGFERVIGSASYDTLIGDDRANILQGGLKADNLRGGGGKDIFDYDSRLESRNGGAFRDHISDFNANAQDKIDLSDIDAIGGGKNDSFTFIGEAEFSDLGQVRYEKSSGGVTYVEVNCGKDNRIDMTIFLPAGLDLDASDFIL